MYYLKNNNAYLRANRNKMIVMKKNKITNDKHGIGVQYQIYACSSVNIYYAGNLMISVCCQLSG